VLIVDSFCPVVLVRGQTAAAGTPHRASDEPSASLSRLTAQQLTEVRGYVGGKRVARLMRRTNRGSSTSERGVTAVDEVVPAGDERRLLRQEEAHEVRHLLGLTEPAERVPLDERVMELGRKAGEQRGLDVSGTHAVDPQALGAVLRRANRIGRLQLDRQP
jgi:hypothetical protein